MNLRNVEQARFNMIEQQVRPWNVDDSSVLELLASVKREDFVPLAHKALAFADLEIPLPGGQAMLTPRLQARLMQDLALQPTDKVLEIGTGSGYTTALMARQAQRVLSLEINPEIATLARANLQKANITNVEVRVADGAAGAAADAPFDAILLGGSVTEVPQALLGQLKEGGRLIAIVGNEPIMHAMLIERTGPTHYKTTEKWDSNAPRLQNFPEPSAFRF
ncbi:MAG: protein-L-isoaspartate O-methyltransferase [Rhodoferax sp.]|nr:protein-L-isoaspartate O-methyltransferase [Rhodoferax sp.]OIP23418.1 MAG: protein-L-isoaspartate O-methyltransferase [Comamonadaceae bacterium CG2_30_60_41]PIW09769.1 MAG: protein-L-isoaspartate O-methyltransferase [Comamonadaceae bacterium CG17_big_fil_post_rev_8_21_14_2_50_60_13]PIY27328.1 MAG: protein-L-isoaspartate O-methyltransferase [Comamonadaceae bacterium CG_4_10_14_3_um_filter_60_75]PJC18721.1 MAG: protein-L-isoaspartate O-methyltransferase [Comamonadaceae bacterium CG_4_9_14_0_8_